METPTWPESLPNNRIQAIQELKEGREPTDKLRKVLQWSQKTDTKSIDGALVQMITVFENTLSAIGYNKPLKLPTSDVHSSDHSPRTVNPVKVKRGCYKRRKNSWTSANVTSVLIDDGHAWRKYGQKEIHNSKYQRSYYRCTYKDDQGCLAKKQVQMIEDKPPNYKITYYGHHTCKRARTIILDCRDPKDTSTLYKFDTKEIIEKKQIEPNFPRPTMKHEQNDCFPTSCNTYQSLDQFTDVAQIPLEETCMMPSELDINVDLILEWLYSGLDYGDEIAVGEPSSMASSQTYEMDHMFEMDDFCDFSV